MVGHEILDLFVRGRQAGQIKRCPPDNGELVGRRSHAHIGGGLFTANPMIDVERLIARGQRLERPVLWLVNLLAFSGQGAPAAIHWVNVLT